MYYVENHLKILFMLKLCYDYFILTQQIKIKTAYLTTTGVKIWMLS